MRIWGAHTRDFRLLHHVRVDADVELTTNPVKPLYFRGDAGSERRHYLTVPTNDAPVVADVPQVLAAEAMRLGPKTRVSSVTERLRRVLHRLTKRGATVAQAIDTRTHVEMGVDIEDADRPPSGDITEVVAIGGFVSTAKDDGNGAALKDRANDLSQSLLGVLQPSGNPDVARVQRRFNGQVRAELRVPGSEAVQPPANFGRALCRAFPAAVAANAVVLRKADEHSSAGTYGRPGAAPKFNDFTQTRIVCSVRKINGGFNRFKPRKPRGRV